MKTTDNTNVQPNHRRQTNGFDSPHSPCLFLSLSVCLFLSLSFCLFLALSLSARVCIYLVNCIMKITDDDGDGDKDNKRKIKNQITEQNRTILLLLNQTPNRIVAKAYKHRFAIFMFRYNHWSFDGIVVTPR